jgi:cytochrome c-type biogenesis protein CcmH
MKFLILAFSFFLVSFSDVKAVEPDEIMDDPALEARAREVSKEIRCVVCQNQSIDDSDSSIAKNMRVIVRERIEKGDSNQEVIDYLVSRYGDFVLLKPPVKIKTMVLWFGPALMLGLGLVGIIFYYRRRATQSADTTHSKPLSADEKARLDALLKEETD